MQLRESKQSGGAGMTAAVDVEALARPIAELLAGFGAGGMAGDTGAGLREASAAIDEIHASGRDGINGMYGAWRGPAGDAAMDKAMRVQASAAMVSDRGNAMAEVVDRATGVITAGQRDLEEILRSFLAEAKGFESAGFSPAGVAAIVGSAVDHFGRALSVVGRVRAELEAQTAAMNDLVAPTPAPAPVSPIGVGYSDPQAVVPVSVSTPSGPQQFGSAVAAAGSRAVETGSGLMGSLLTVPASTGESPAKTGDHRLDSASGTHTSPTGVRLTLPDGSTVEAPNQQAADAVRNALSAVGTPYLWGGTTPGSGLDCSGLTQWAYAQAGVGLPRLAQEQGNGHAQIGPGDLMPGDLAVWDGHVAMVIGNGQLVEAGNPVQIGAIRTENMGMRFLGFYRPTT
ncbi:C40 family peptidase [Nocardia sp. NPDC051030]|uniref:C40 family peptidase n=1 Tax=Nocardia sp. NPDC051030 TaxID=3155162 RepID=UPI0034486B69